MLIFLPKAFCCTFQVMCTVSPSMKSGHKKSDKDNNPCIIIDDAFFLTLIYYLIHGTHLEPFAYVSKDTMLSKFDIL